jgi:hypothetical protein
MMGSDIRYIKTNTPDFSPVSGFRFGTPLYFSLALLPFLIFGGVSGWTRYKNKQAGNQALLRMKNATGVARKRLSNARNLMNGQNEPKVFEEIHKAVWGYLGDKFTIPNAQLSREYIIDTLKQRAVKPELTDAVLKCIDECELARYGGSFAGIKSDELYKSTEQVITALEEEVKA